MVRNEIRKRRRVEGKPYEICRYRVGINFTETDFRSDSRGKIGWGGRIRTFTIHINSVVSYRLDHAPAAFVADERPNK
jgi:hypothetical protein